MLRKNNGFSLIELMVVVSIASTVVSIALPNIVMIKIKAARAEMTQNLRVMRTLGEAARADNDSYPVGSFSYGVADFGGEIINCNPNFLGFSVPSCQKLRYHYVLNSSNPTGIYVEAWSFYWRDLGGEGESAGYGPVTTKCKTPDPGLYAAWYSDFWYMSSEGTLTANGGDHNDMVKTCI